MTDTTGTADITGPADGIAIIPRPISLERTGEGYRLTAPVIVRAGDDVATATGILGERLGGTTPAKDGESPQVTIALDEALGAEAYELTSGPDGVTITGGDAAGAFYGAITLLQLMPPEVFSDKPGTGWQVPGVRITDRPAYGWRGSHLDCARHFMPLDFVLKYIDLLALHKLNTFHWHLTEDQGWRLQIDKYPKLTEVGAWRSETILWRPDGNPANERYNKTPHGGFYTKDDVRAVLAHARSRHVRVMPEIELPGHSQAAIAAYPELGNTGEPIEVGKKWGIIYDVLNVEDSTISFFQDVFDEVVELFDSPYIHVGGDECPKAQWEASPRAQQRMEDLDLPDEEHLQSWFIRQFDDHLNRHGRTLVGWDEILEGGLAQNAVVMSWRGEEGGIAAARAGHDVVMAPHSHTYLDHYQSKDRDRHTYSIGGYNPLSHAYTYRPTPKELSGDEARHVLGAQFQVWTEYMPTPGHVEAMVFPRACALSECFWHPEPGDFADFRARLDVHARRLDELNVGYYPLGLAE